LIRNSTPKAAPQSESRVTIKKTNALGARVGVRARSSRWDPAERPVKHSVL